MSHHVASPFLVEFCGSRLIGVHFLPLHTCSSLLSPGAKITPFEVPYPDIVPGFSAYQIDIVLCFKHIDIIWKNCWRLNAHWKKVCCKAYLRQHPERSYKSPVYIVCIYIYHMHNDRSLYIIIPLYIITHHNHTLNPLYIIYISFIHHYSLLITINHH